MIHSSNFCSVIWFAVSFWWWMFIVLSNQINYFHNVLTSILHCCHLKGPGIGSLVHQQLWLQASSIPTSAPVQTINYEGLISIIWNFMRIGGIFSNSWGLKVVFGCSRNPMQSHFARLVVSTFAQMKKERSHCQPSKQPFVLWRKDLGLEQFGRSIFQFVPSGRIRMLTWWMDLPKSRRFTTLRFAYLYNTTQMCITV